MSHDAQPATLQMTALRFRAKNKHSLAPSSNAYSRLILWFPLRASRIFSFSDERWLLTALSEFVVGVDLDALVGYNHGRFDIPFLLARTKKLGLAEFGALGRIKGKF